VRVPLLDLRQQYASIRGDVLAAIERVCDSQQFILGVEVEEFEREMAAAIGVRAAIGVSSGTDALLVALMALGVGPGDEVVTTPFSFFATAGSVARLGARPVFVDVDPDTLMLTASGVQAAITPRTRAIIPVHLFGLCADMDPIAEVASSAGIPVVEDAAQAIGATCHGRQAGALGRIACFSFFPSKNLGAFGDAGLVTTDDEALASRVRRLRNHGAEPKYYHHEIGGNFRLDALQAVVLIEKLRHLDGWTAGRQANAAFYDERFAAAKIGAFVKTPVAKPGRHIYNQYVIRCERRDALRQFLTGQGVGSEIYYPVSLHSQQCFAYLGHAPGDFPESTRAAAETLALPIYPELSREQLAYVVDRIAAFYRP
jgi:dTDP-4-amino-4,6-dideoxygalactose transaminase